MRKQKAIDHFGSVTALAAALDITTQAISQWRDTVPELTAYKLQVITAGALRVDERLYPRRKSA